VLVVGARIVTLVLCVFEIEGKALCIGAGLVPARLATGFGPTGDHKGRPYERTDPFNFG
jgi:hypothetical protein